MIANIPRKKQTLREEARSLSSLLFWGELSVLISRKLFVELLEICKVNFHSELVVLSYQARPRELDLSDLHQKLLAAGAQVHLIQNHFAPSFRELTWSELKAQYLPLNLNLAELNCCLVPGLLFTPSGARLGQGLGFYDRLIDELAGLSAVKTVGVIPEALLRADLPLDLWDKHVDLVVTERSL